MWRQQGRGVRLSVVVTLSLLAATRAAGAPTPSAARDLSAPGQVLTSELFSFHSDALLNLHHFLYRWGQAGPGADATDVDSSITLGVADSEPHGRLSAEERDAWDNAVAFYRSSMIQNDLRLDDDMVELRDCIAYAGNYCDDVAGAYAEALDVLQRTMNVYRAHWWRRHNRVNRAWAEQLLPAVRRFENAIAPSMTEAYGGGWPDPWTRVDVMPYANRVGGYTTGHPHITVSSIEPGTQGYLGLELLFHEASHGDTLERPLRRLISESFEATGGARPPDLWHMTIFFTAGDLTRTVLEATEESDYTPYAEFVDIWGRGPDNRQAYDLLREFWRPALQAGTGYRAAMRRVAAAWVQSTR